MTADRGLSNSHLRRLGELSRRVGTLEREKGTSGSPGGTYPGADLCGGIGAGAGAFAQGNGAGTSLTMTVGADVPCAATIVIVAASYVSAVDFGAIITACVDSRGRIYHPGVSACSDAVGIGPYQAVEVSFAIGWTGAGGIHSGDTITLTFSAGGNTIDETVAMAFAITDVGTAYNDSSNGISYPALTGTTGSDLEWALVTGVGEPTASFAGYTGGVITGVAQTPAVGGWSPTQGTWIGENFGTNVAVSASLIPRVDDGVSYEPGGAIGGSTVAAANYVELFA